MSNPKQQITPKEIKATIIALTGIIEDLESSLKNTDFNFNPAARKDMKDLLATSKSALEKFRNTSGFTATLEPYKEGDENEFLTKQS
jgi:hypothetical protein